jgi:hypothetical protein
MKKLVLLLVLCTCHLSFGQEPDPTLFRTWYLVELNVAGTSYVSSEYGYYSDMILDDSNLPAYTISFADPDHDSCTSEITFSETAPELEFQLLEEPFCFPTSTCDGNPQGGCVIMREAQSNFYVDSVATPLVYSLTDNQDGTFYLLITNDNGDIAYYGSEPFLSTSPISKIDFSVFPNPVTDILSVASSGFAVEKITVYGLNGKRFFTEEGTNNVSLATLPSGLYIVEVSANGERNFQKIVKK